MPIADRPGPWNHRAFTLLELIVVMVLIALATSLATPQIASFLAADQLKTSVRKLTGLVIRSSQLAQERQASHLLRYLQRERRFVLESEYPLDQERLDGRQAGKAETRKDGELRLTGSVVVRDVWTMYGGIQAEGEIAIRFNGSGYVEPTVIHLREEGGKELSLVLSPFLGAIQVVDSYVNPERDDLFQ